LDKCRATIAGKNGEYHYDCPIDQRFFYFAGIDPAELRAQIEKGLGDGEILAWVTENSKTKPEEWEIANWSGFREAAVPGDNESREFVNEMMSADGADEREDIQTWFDVLDLDDHVTFGGKA
tara:strand:+ start:8810 stop:9175 length:366 start_codon:yes stop_codon:yes gene_type:complete